MEMDNENKALRLVQWLSDQAIDGEMPLWSARDLAANIWSFAPLGLDSEDKDEGLRT